MYDLPWWVMGLMCLVVFFLPVLLVVVIVVAVSGGAGQMLLTDLFGDEGVQHPGLHGPFDFTAFGELRFRLTLGARKELQVM